MLIVSQLSGKQVYYIKKYRLDSDGNTIVFGNFHDTYCPECKCTLKHPLMYEKHLIYSKCEDCCKKLPMHHLFELGGIPDCGCYCYDCMIKMNCCFKEAEWRKCDTKCPLCVHDEYCKHNKHFLHEIFKCGLCKDYI